MNVASVVHHSLYVYGVINEITTVICSQSVLESLPYDSIAVITL